MSLLTLGGAYAVDPGECAIVGVRGLLLSATMLGMHTFRPLICAALLSLSCSSPDLADPGDASSLGDPCYGHTDVEESGGVVIESAKYEDCSSGLCLFTTDDQQGQCTCSCKAGCMCPDGWTCKDILDEAYCLPEDVARELGDVALPR